jgi:endonuclease/exonuclease/phosphatase (EEP) superfamily protein YafD
VRGAGLVLERPTRGRWLAIGLLAGANLALAAVICTGFSVVSDAIAPLTGHFICLGLTASLALMLRRWTLPLLVAGTVATAGVHVWLGLAACCGPAAALARAQITQIAAQASPQALTVLALNTWDKLDDARPIASYLATVPADVVVLSEFGEGKGPLLDDLKAAYPYQASCARDWHCSLALLSRVPLEASGVGRVTSEGPDFIWARVGGSLTIVGTHVHRPSRNPWLHERQVLALAQFMRRIDGAVVLAGDLNTSPWSNAFRRLRNVSGLVSASTLLPTWPVWPLPLPQVALDHILVSSDLAVTAAGTGPAVGSDHLPIWA